MTSISGASELLVIPGTKTDDHLSKEAHQVLADGVCTKIAGSAASCRPPRWTSSQRAGDLVQAAGVSSSILTGQLPEASRLAR